MSPRKTRWLDRLCWFLSPWLLAALAYAALALPEIAGSAP